MEAPHLSRIAQQHRDNGLVVLSVNAWDEDQKTVRNFVAKKALKQQFLLQGSAVHRAYGFRSLPVSVWINREGIIRDVELGFEGPSNLQRTTKRLLDGE